MSESEKKSAKKPDHREIGRAACQACGGEYFKIPIYGGGGWIVRCSHCGEDWLGQDGP